MIIVSSLVAVSLLAGGAFYFRKVETTLPMSFNTMTDLAIRCEGWASNTG